MAKIEKFIFDTLRLQIAVVRFPLKFRCIAGCQKETPIIITL